MIPRHALVAAVLATSCGGASGRSSTDAAASDAALADPVIQVVLVGPMTTASSTVTLSVSSFFGSYEQHFDVAISDSLDTPHVVEIRLPRAGLWRRDSYGVAAKIASPKLCGFSAFGLTEAVSSVEVLLELSTCPPPPVPDCVATRCPPQAAGSYCVVGRATRFLEDGKPLAQRAPVSSSDGACATVYDPIDFVVGMPRALGRARDPGMRSEESRLDGAGCFVIEDLPETGTHLLVVAIDDCGQAPSDTLQGQWALTAVLGEQMLGLTTIDLTEELQTPTAISVAEAQSLISQAEAAGHRGLLHQGGAYVMIFREPEVAPFPAVPGVVPIAPASEYVNASNTVYFGADLVTLDPTRPYAMGVSAPTGAALITAPQVTQHSGMNTLAGPAWDTSLLGATNGAFVVRRWRLKRQ